MAAESGEDLQWVSRMDDRPSGYVRVQRPSAAAPVEPDDGGEALRREGCIRADKACRWRPATTSDANPDDLVCDGCGGRQRPMSEVERIEDLRDEYPQNGPLGKPDVRADETLATEVKRLHVLAAHRLDAMTEAKRVERDLRAAAAAAVRERREEPLRREVERLRDLSEAATPDEWFTAHIVGRNPITHEDADLIAAAVNFVRAALGAVE